MEYFIYGFKLHPITFILLVLEFSLLYRYIVLNSIKDKKWHFMMLSILFFCTAKQLFLPQLFTKYDPPAPVQFFLGRGFGYILASFYPIFLTKMLPFNNLRWHGRFGWLCVLAPVSIIFVIIHAIHQNLFLARIYMMILPTIYLIILITHAGYLILSKYRSTTYRHILAQLMIVLSVGAWLFVPFMSIYQNSPIWLCDTMLNLPFILYCFFFDGPMIPPKNNFNSRIETESVDESMSIDYLLPKDPFLETSRRFGLSPAEIRVSQLLLEQYDYKEVAKKLNRDTRTIEKHSENIRKKLGVSSKDEVIDKFLSYMKST